MPKIELKPNSPEYADPKRKAMSPQKCDIAGCAGEGLHKAPKTRGLDAYYVFCIDHVKDYNASWDFFNGMSAREVEEHMLRSLYGDRPTWNYADGQGPEDFLKRRAWQAYHFTEAEPPEQKQKSTGMTYHHQSPEFQAMVTLGLEPPLDMAILKKQYKVLAKKHHPDYNRDCTESEALLKEINLAYTILKTAFEKYEKMQENG